MKITNILDALNTHRIRATYGAVGQCLGIPAIAVSQRLGSRRPEASWIVSAASGKPTGYASTEYHPALFSNSRILGSASELQALLESNHTPTVLSEPCRLAGVDLAWLSEKNGSGIAIGSLVSRELTTEKVYSGVKGLDSVLTLLDSVTNLRGVAIDAPLIINNDVGRRNCESELGSVYSSKWAGCHPANISLYPNASSVRLSNSLGERGFVHLGDPAREKWQVECYPHPAIIEIFGLEKRLAYKKGSVAERRCGQVELARLIRGLSTNTRLKLRLNSEAKEITDAKSISALGGQRLKDNEDGLDAIICLYIAGLFSIGSPGRCFGETDDGYIWVPC